MTHARGGQIAGATLFHFIVGPERAIKQEKIAIPKQPLEIGIDGRNIRQKEQPPASAWIGQSISNYVIGARHRIFRESRWSTTKRNFAVEQAALGSRPIKQRCGCTRRFDPLHPAKRLYGRTERKSVFEPTAHAFGGMNAQPLPFAQLEQPERMVEIGIGEQHCLNRRSTHPIQRWMQRRKTFNLKPQIRRRIKKKPMSVI